MAQTLEIRKSGAGRETCIYVVKRKLHGYSQSVPNSFEISTSSPHPRPYLKMRISTVVKRYLFFLAFGLSFQDKHVSVSAIETGIKELTKSNKLISDFHQQDKKSSFRSFRKSGLKALTDVEPGQPNKDNISPPPNSPILKDSRNREPRPENDSSNRVKGSLHADEVVTPLSGYAPEFYNPKTRSTRSKENSHGNTGIMAPHGNFDHTNHLHQSETSAADRSLANLRPPQNLVYLDPIDRQKWMIGHIISESPVPILSHVVKYAPTESSYEAVQTKDPEHQNKSLLNLPLHTKTMHESYHSASDVGNTEPKNTATGNSSTL